MVGDDITCSRLNDLKNQCEKYNYTVFSKFLSLQEQQYGINMKNVAIFGGYEESERKIVAFYPDYVSTEEIVWPISLVNIFTTDKNIYTHRDFLGSLLGLGIKRDVVGDIVVIKNQAQVFCLENIAGYIAENLTHVSKSGVEIEIKDLSCAVSVQKQFEEITGSVASCRLDSVIAVAIKKSRKTAVELIESGRANVNFKENLNVSYGLKQNDILSIRGFGKFIFDGEIHTSKKGRCIIKLRKYI